MNETQVHVMLSTEFWSALAAFRKPNSSMPEGVATATFLTYSVATIIWWYARTKLIFETQSYPQAMR